MKLSDIADLTTGFPFDGTKYTDEGIRVVRGETIGEEVLKWDDRLDKRWNEDFPKAEQYSLHENDIVMQMDGNIGKNMSRIIASQLPLYIAQRVACIRAKDNNDQDYIYYLLRTSHFQEYISRQTTGTSIQHVSLQQIGEYNFDFSSPERQKKIASFLRKLDDKIILNREINKNLEALAKQLYDYWFVQFDFPNEEGKPYKSSGGKMVWNDKLKREIPEGWEYLTINKITDVITGKEDANFSVANGKFPFFTCSKDNLRCDKSAFSGHAILVAGNGDFNVKHYSGEFNAYQRTYVLIPKDDKYYGVMYYSSLDKIDSFKAKSNGSIIKFITKGDIESIGVFNAPNSSNASLYLLLNIFLEEIETRLSEIENLTNLRDELLPLLMNGQVKLND